MAKKTTHWYHYDFWGLTIAIIFGAVSFTPSLLPREPALQGLIAGITAVTGYLVGVILHWLFRQFTSWEPPPRIQKIAWIILICSGIIAGIDRKSTRLNSSHVAISYAVFCLKK